MTFSSTTTRLSRRYLLEARMDSTQDKEERKREYNRLAQREFRRRRKEHLKNLEQAQKEQSSEQSEEIERLRYQNDELRRENEALRAQIFGSSSSSSSHLLSAPINIPSISDTRQYSLSPSLSGTSMSGHGSPPPPLASEMMPMSSLSLTSSMLTPSMQAYADPSALSSQPYSIVHPSGLRHNSQSSPESSGFRTSRSAMGPSFQSLNIAQSVEATTGTLLPGQRRPSGQPPTMVMVPYDRSKAKSEILDLFRPLYSDPSINDSSRHLSLLRTMSDTLPPPLKPSKAQLETPHYYGIDMIASPSLRERLLTVTTDVARTFCADLGLTGGGERDEVGQVIIWGEEPLNEMSWELSQPLLERWGWLLGTGWTQRANFWRRQRGAPVLAEW